MSSILDFCNRDFLASLAKNILNAIGTADDLKDIAIAAAAETPNKKLVIFKHILVSIV